MCACVWTPAWWQARTCGQGRPRVAGRRRRGGGDVRSWGTSSATSLASCVNLKTDNRALALLLVTAQSGGRDLEFQFLCSRCIDGLQKIVLISCNLDAFADLASTLNLWHRQACTIHVSSEDGFRSAVLEVCHPQRACKACELQRCCALCCARQLLVLLQRERRPRLKHGQGERGACLHAAAAFA